jgi:16S rRNA (guanine527-N7)-methyltransferase
VLVESVGKKARFLETVVAATGFAERVEVLAERAEEVAASVAAGARPRADIVTARAVASLAELVELSMPLLRIGGSLLAWKRGAVDAEVAETARAAGAVGAGPPVVHGVGGRVLPGHVIVSVTKRASTPEGYPRDPATRRRRPW